MMQLRRHKDGAAARHKRNCPSLATVASCPSESPFQQDGVAAATPADLQRVTCNPFLMEFLNPLALAALAAAAIPLIIHLFNFRRPRKVDFSSLEFVKELQKTTMQRVRIKQWLLLLLRILAIACLVIAFARPTLTGDVAGAVGGQARSSVAVVIDNSLSMTLRDAEGEYLRQAKDIAAGIIDELGGGDEVFVLSTSSEQVSPPRYTNIGSAIEGVETIEPSTGSTPLSHVVARAGAVLEDASNLNREIYVISDLQQSTFSDTVDASIPEDIRTYLLPIGERTHANLAVTDVRVESRIIEIGQPVRITATIVNYGTDPVEGYVASVFLDGDRVAQATADVAPNVPTTVTLTTTPQSRGWLEGIVRIEEDAFEFDNQRFFTLHVPERRSVLLVQGEGQETQYVELALSPELGRNGVAFDVTTISETGLAAAGLSGYDAVVVIGPQSLSSGEIAALERYVSSGGGLFLTPASEASAGEYNDLLQALNAGRFTGFSGSLGSQRSIAGFDQVDLQHPLFEGVFNRRDRGADIQVESPDIYYAMNYTAGSGNEQTVVSLSNGFPFLQEIRHGQGVVFLLTVAPNARWSDLPVRGLFIPMLYRSMYYLSASESVSGEQLTAARSTELRIPRVSEAEQLRLVSPGGTEYVPEQRNLFGALLLSIDGSVLDRLGIYDVRSEDGLVRRVAVNLAAEESDLRTLADRQGREQLEESLSEDVTLIDLDGAQPGDVVDAVAQQRTGVELWNLFLLLALTCLIAEMIVAKQWRPEAVPA